MDEVNIKFENLDVITRRKLSDAVKFFIPSARHMPAFKLGRWDGCVRFCDIGARSYLNILDKLIPIVESAGYLIHIDDRRQHFDSIEFDPVVNDSYQHVKWPEGHTMAGESMILRDHQVEVINKYLENYQSIQNVPTGAGKTFISAVLADKASKYGRTLLIVPSTDLVMQTHRDFKNMGLDVGVYYGGKKEPGKTHTICTWQSLEALDKKSKDYDPDFNIDEFIDGVNCVIVDEAHGLKADVLKKHLTTTLANVPIRWAMTGTIPEAPQDEVSLICCIGPIVNKMKAKDLQDVGILSNLHIDVLQLNDYHTIHTSYQSELKFLVTDKTRLEWICNHVQEQRKEGNTLILVDRVLTGDIIKEFIPDAVFISGEVDTKDRKKEYEAVQNAENKVIVATYGVAAVGIDLPRIFNLYLVEPGKSFVRVIQSVGRGIRKAKDKDFVNIFDVTSTAKYAKKHLAQRKKFYKDAEYPYRISKIDYLGAK